MKPLRSRPFTGFGIEQVINYLRVDLPKLLADLVEGLRHVTFEENFDSFVWTGTIAGSSSATIPNRFGTNSLKWWPVRISGAADLVETTVNKDVVVISNLSATATVVTLLFVR